MAAELEVEGEYCCQVIEAEGLTARTGGLHHFILTSTELAESTPADGWMYAAVLSKDIPAAEKTSDGSSILTMGAATLLGAILTLG